MDGLESKNVAVNLQLFKFFGFQQILDPNRSRPISNVVDWNVYGLTVIAIASMSLVISLVTFLNTLSEFHNDIIDDLYLMQLMSCYTLNIRSVLIAFMFVFKAKLVWKSFDVTRFDFLSAPICRKHIPVLWKYRHHSILISNLFTIALNLGMLVWCIYPFLFYNSVSSHNAEVRRENVFNLLYPVSVRVYNDYFPLFYTLDISIITQNGYFYSIFNAYFISFCYIFIAEYNVIALAYEDVGYDRGCEPLQIDRGK